MLGVTEFPGPERDPEEDTPFAICSLLTRCSISKYVSWNAPGAEGLDGWASSVGAGQKG